MLKKLVLNHKTIPVPVPIKNLGEALEWVSQTFLKGDQVITKILLERKEVDESRLEKISLNPNSRLEFLADSPEELSVQTLEAMRNLTCVIERQLKPLAVHCWEVPSNKVPDDIESISSDLNLIAELVKHFLDLTSLEESHLKTIHHYDGILQITAKNLNGARGRRDWKAFAKVLLNELEPLAADLISETGNLSALIFQSRIERPKLSQASPR